MAKGKITKSSVDALAAKSGEMILWDTELRGFGLKVTRGGRKVYIAQYRLGGRAGKSQRVQLGVHGTLTPDQARARAKVVLGQVADGIDVAADKRQQKTEDRSARTILSLSADFITLHVRPKLKPSSAEEYERLFSKVINPALGRQLARDVPFGDVERFHHNLAATPAQANRALAVLSKFFSWAIRGGYRPDRQNPCSGVERFAERRKERFLSHVEMAALGEALRRAETEGLPWTIDESRPTAKHLPKDAANRRTVISPFAAAAIRMLIFTGARTGEILPLKWDHVDMDAKLLRLPDSKTGAKTIVLNAPALVVISKLARIDGNPYVFPGLKPGSHIVDLKRTWDAIRKSAGLEGVRKHDLRHTAASLARSSGVPLTLIGGLLGHRNASTTERYAHLYDDPLREAAEKVGRHADELLSRGAQPSATVHMLEADHKSYQR